MLPIPQINNTSGCLSIEVGPLKKYIHFGRSGIVVDLSGTRSLERRTKLLIIRDLVGLHWTATRTDEKIILSPPTTYDRESIRRSLLTRRMELIERDRTWIETHADLAGSNLAEGLAVLESEICPFIEECRTQDQLDIFRYFRYYWSSPYSEYVGRRMKLLIRDAGHPSKPLIGIVALGSAIVHMPERDLWVGWDTKTRTGNLVYVMDAYVLGALPPYNYLLGGKLLSYLIASNEVRDLYRAKYQDQVTQISQRTANDLACIFTTSLYGRSSQYNRLKYRGTPLFIPIGETRGYGTLHLSDETFNTMRELLKAKKISVTNRFGDGPIWRMRVIRSVGDYLGFNSDALLKHSFRRHIYAIPLAENFRDFLKSKTSQLNYFDYPLEDLATYWKERWFKNRRANQDVRAKVEQFRVRNFDVIHATQ